MSRRDHIVFDLDGTLVDSAVLCVGIINEMLRERGSARSLTVDMAKPHMSCGGANFVGKLLGDECGDLDSELADFRKRYRAIPTPADCLYDGVEGGLQRLSAIGMTMAICSNKPQTLCEKIIGELDLQSYFPVIVGSQEGRRPKPHPEMFALTVAYLGTTADRCMLVGDSDQDHALAQAAGVPLHFVTYGYSSPDWSADGLRRHHSFGDLVEAIAGEHGGSAALHNAA